MTSPNAQNPPRAACARCHDKKIKCDSRLPRCSACEKLDLVCNPPTSFGSDRVKSLQTREAELKQQVAMARASSAGSTVESGLSKGQPRRVHDNGMGFVDLVFAKIRKEVIRSSLKSYRRVRQTLPAASPAASHSVAAPSMAPNVAASLFDAYTRRSHSRHPFLCARTILKLKEKAVASATGECDRGNMLPGDSFRAYIIMAIGLVYQKQELSIEQGLSTETHYLLEAEPLDLFAFALRDLKRVNLSHGLESVQNLQLIARFGFFYPIGISTWDISFVCMRICIECGFHRPPRSRLHPMEEQMHRRVFWQAYNLDRHWATTLGRPFTLPDDSITVSLPANIDDASLDEMNSIFPNHSLDELLVAQNSGKNLTDMTLAISQTSLRRITSEMFRFLRQSRHKPATRCAAQSDVSQTRLSESEVLEDLIASQKVRQLYFGYISKLQQWRHASKQYCRVEPTPGTPAEVLMQDTRWIDLHFYQERLSLIRLVIDPESGQTQCNSGLIDAMELVKDLSDAARNIIELYSQLIGDAKIEPTPGRLYRVLIAGLSILYAVIIESQTFRIHQRQPIQLGLEFDSTPQWFADRESTLRQCTDTLERMAKLVTYEHLRPKYVGYFELLYREVLRHVSRNIRRASGGIRSVSPTSRIDHISSQLSDAPRQTINCGINHDLVPGIGHFDHEPTADNVSRESYNGLPVDSNQFFATAAPSDGPLPADRVWRMDTGSRILTGYSPDQSTSLPHQQQQSAPADFASPLICQHPTLHPFPCYCGLTEVPGINEEVFDNWWTGEGSNSNAINLPLNHGSDGQDLMMLFNEWDESSGMWQSLIRQSSGQFWGA